MLFNKFANIAVHVKLTMVNLLYSASEKMTQFTQ